MQILKVVDLFCGGGGISEGLKQAGFDIVYGLDSSKAATDTFKLNHPNAISVTGLVEDVQIEEIPEFDILVGGPPCVEFSSSKQGRGNILDGLKLVQAFLRVVHLRKPKYWIMENVPNIVLHLPESFPLSWIGIDEPGELHVPNRAEFNMASYGVPQARKRFLMGNFPLPVATHHESNSSSIAGSDTNQSWRCLSDVLKSLPSPLKKKPKGMVRDINYGFELNINSLSDHFHEVELQPDESRRIRRAKESHPFMGRMPFPDKLNRPARTVVATQLGRETLVIGESINKIDRFRRATVRECAVIQGYPLSYQFLGSSLSARYRIVGNGVPPMLIYRIGELIRKDAGMKKILVPFISKIPSVLSPAILKQTQRKKFTYKSDRRFSELVPGKEVRGFRVELVNWENNNLTAQLYSNEAKHIVEWGCLLTVGEGKSKMHQKIMTVDSSIRLLEPLFLLHDESDQLLEMIDSLSTGVIPFLCDASTLQASWIGKPGFSLSPEHIVDSLCTTINDSFPASKYSEKYIPSHPDYDFLPSKGVRIRLAVAALVVSYCCEIINRDGAWVSKNKAKRYTEDTWGKSSKSFAIAIPKLAPILRKAIRQKRKSEPDLLSVLD